MTLPVTAIFQSFTVYPDGLGGVLALTGLWALLRADEEEPRRARRAASLAAARRRAGAAAVAALAICRARRRRSGALVLLRLGSTKNPAGKAVAFLGDSGDQRGAVGRLLHRDLRPARSVRAVRPGGDIGSFAFVPGGLGGLLFDQRFGLVTYAPVVAVAFAGLVAMFFAPAIPPPRPRTAVRVTPYLLTVTHFAMWWGGSSPPARFFAPVLPLFAVPAAVAWTLATAPRHARHRGMSRWC